MAAQEATAVMKAIRVHTREGTKAIIYEDAPVRTIGTGEVLVRVHAAATTPTDFTWNSIFATSERLPTGRREASRGDFQRKDLAR